MPVQPKSETARPKSRPAARVGDGSRTARRGFASMDPAKQRSIASQGGLASHASGLGHKWTTDEARAAGRKGGQLSRRGPGPGKAVG